MQTEKDDLDWTDSQPFTTAWTSQQTRRTKRTYGTYGRRGASNSNDRTRQQQPQSSFVPSDHKKFLADENEGLDSSQTSWSSELGYERASGSSSSFSSDAAAACMGSSDPCIGHNTATTTSNSASRRVVPPLRPSKKQHRRSISASIPPKIPRPVSITRCSTTSHSSTTSSIQSVLQGYDEENAHPNELNEIGEAASPSHLGRRKKVRARRASMSMMSGPSTALRRGNSVPAFHPSQSMSNLTGGSPSLLSRRNSMPNLEDVDLSWLHGSATQLMPSPQGLRRHDSGELTDATATSPGGQSISASSTVSSSRKRGMSEDPSEGNDDTSVAGAFAAPRTSFECNSASRACRVLSPGFGGGRQGSTLTYATVKIVDENAFVGTGRAMTLDSDSEDESDSDDADVSVESTTQEEDVDSDESPSKDAVPGMDGMKPVRTEEDVLRTMPCYQDLKYLTNKLLHEKEKHEKSPSFYERLGYLVKLPKGWTSERREAFVNWTSKGLGLSLRASNASESFLQTPPAKGNAIFKLLHSAVVMRKRQELRGQSTTADQSAACREKAPIILDASSDLGSMPKKQARAATRHNLANFSTNSTDSMLIEGMTALSFQAKDPRLVRLVTVETSSLHKSKLKLDLSSPMDSSRPSLDSHVGADNDFIFHMQGLSPAARPIRPIRPPRSSLGSVASALSHARQMNTTGLSATGPSSCLSAAGAQQPIFEFVATPLMKQCQGWGSQPSAGKDWGDSEKCSERIIAALIRNCNASLHEAGLYDSKEDAMDDFTSMLPTRSADLCLDLEADSCSDDDDDDEYYSDSERDVDSFAPMVDRDTGVAFDMLGELPSAEKLRDIRRRNTSLAKHRRMSVCVSSSSSSSIYQRKSLFERTRQSYAPSARTRDLSASFDCFNLPSAERQEPLDSEQPLIEALAKKNILPHIFSFLQGPELLTSVSLVCQSWADASTDAYAELMIASVGCSQDDDDDENDADYEILDDDEIGEDQAGPENSIALSMQRPWNYLLTNFPYASFLSEGAFKRVYKVKNAVMKAPEAVSIMDVDKIESTGNKSVVATELAVSVMLSSLARRGICPNFVVTRGVFTCPFEPPVSHWGCAENKNHQVHVKSPKAKRKPKQPSAKHSRRFQYIRMELCTEGDAEEFIKDQPNELLPIEMSRMLLFQISFALHAAASKFSLKHYDLKLLNVFLQGASNVPGAKVSATGDVVLRYGLGSKNFALSMPVETALLAKLADYGTADVKAESNGQPLSLAQITTPENTPPDFLVLGDAAKQGHEHDLFGLGLCMLHLFTGKAPYEEILEDVQCPSSFKKMLQALWEDENAPGYSVIRSFVLAEVYTDEAGNITDGEADDTFYDTLYRFLVLFGIPEHKFQRRQHGRVWRAITDSFGTAPSKRGRDATPFARDQRKYSLSHGTNKFIARARRNLESIEGGMELLKSLVDFDPDKRATALDVLNSEFFAQLTEVPGTTYRNCDDVRSFNAFATL